MLAEAVLEVPDVDQASRRHMHFMLARAYGEAGDALRAVAAAVAAAGSAKNQDDLALRLEAMAAAMKLKTGDVGLAGAAGVRRPVFLLGLPGSGRQAVDAVLNAHPQAVFAGELPTLEELATREGMYPGSLAQLDPVRAAIIRDAYLQRLTDIPKVGACIIDAGDNLVHLGLVARLWPNARVVTVERDPADTAVASYLSGIAERFGWAAGPAELGRYVAAWHGLLRHWREVLPLNFHTLHFDEMNREPEQVLRGLFNFLGLAPSDEEIDFSDQGMAAGTLEHMFGYRLSLEWPSGLAHGYRGLLAPLFATL